VKRWVVVEKSEQGGTKVTSLLVITQAQASDLVLKHVKGLAGLRVCADEKISFAKATGGKISLGKRRHLKFREWP
jgi:hypothetical protein